MTANPDFRARHSLLDVEYLKRYKIDIVQWNTRIGSLELTHTHPLDGVNANDLDRSSGFG